MAGKKAGGRAPRPRPAQAGPKAIAKPKGKTTTVTKRAISKPATMTANHGQTRSSAVNKGQQGARQSMKARHTAPPSRGSKLPSSLASKSSGNSVKPLKSSRGTPGGGDERGTVTNRAKSPYKPSTPRQVAVNPGGLAGFARDVSDRFSRGAAEAGREIGNLGRGGGGRTDPLAKGTLGRDVNGSRGKSWINR